MKSGKIWLLTTISTILLSSCASYKTDLPALDHSKTFCIGKIISTDPAIAEIIAGTLRRELNVKNYNNTVNCEIIITGAYTPTGWILGSGFIELQNQKGDILGSINFTDSLYSINKPNQFAKKIAEIIKKN